MRLPGWIYAKFLRDRWMLLAIPGWTVSIVLHALALLILSVFFLEPPAQTAELDLESMLAEIPEEPELDQLELEPLPLEPPETLKQELPIPEDPAMSALGTVADLSEPAPLSLEEMSPIDNIGAMLVGPGPSGNAPKQLGSTFSSRGQGVRKVMVGVGGGTKQTEQAVYNGLSWLDRHQYPDGHWSLDRHRCRQCSEEGTKHTDMAATAFGLLPFLAAGYTHQGGNPYHDVVSRALGWVLRHQDPQTGNLAKQSGDNMYVHGLGTIVLTEAYGLSRDPRLRAAAQKAIRFVEFAQNPAHGGWRYKPKSATGDTSVVGWQVMALKSAQMAGLRVRPEALELAKKFLGSVSSGKHSGLFGYMPDGNATPTMTAVALLCQQYMGAGRNDRAIQEGMEYLKAHPPSLKFRSAYYWYYATMVMHNMQSTDWDRWNREMRTVWIETQEREKSKCEFGSWDPANPVRDVGHSEAGGRMMVTSMGLLTLEVYYRYLPLYKIMNSEAGLTSTGEDGGFDPNAAK